VVLKGYPRLSETFIAQEILGLEHAGMTIQIVALRKSTDSSRHPVHGEIRAPVHYLPEYLHDEWYRVFRGFCGSLLYPGFYRALCAFIADFRLDPTRHRVRRFGQAFVLATEQPNEMQWLHAHFIHTPASVTAYASMITGIPWTCSAHAKDIWTSPDWELKRKLSHARWVVTCTKSGFERLKRLASDERRVHLSYHGLDLGRFAPFTGTRPRLNGSNPDNPVIIASVGRAVAKKGYDNLLRALALLRPRLCFRFAHIGGGDQLENLKTLCSSLGLDECVDWKGALPQADVLALYRQANIFALACRIAPDGDRDGLPNVIVEACSQGLVCVSTNVSAVPELLTDGINGLIVEPENPQAMADALERLITEPDLRQRLGAAAEQHVRQDFDYKSSIRQLQQLFKSEWRKSP
jgi:glycosyltransferase involved in cell wall biosynthesis